MLDVQTLDDESLASLLRALARGEGVPCDDAEFSGVVKAYRALAAMVRALDACPVPAECEPAPVYSADTDNATVRS
jgi:hypothetical protein